jgi:hypothetical protein
MNEYQQIEDLIARFFDGQTSNEEEQALYRFFAQETVPAHLMRYQPVFGYFETALADECNALETNIPSPHLPRSKRWLAWTGIAAALLAGVLFGMHLLMQPTVDPYEGSYIVRNGVKITDLNLIRPELEATVQEARQQQMEFERLIRQLDEPDDSDDLYLRMEQEIEKQYCEILNQFKDKDIREEVKKILNINCIN